VHPKSQARVKSITNLQCGPGSTQVTGGKWEECSPVHTTMFVNPPASTVQRYTSKGEPCAVPYRWAGNLTWGCVGAGIDPGYCISRQAKWEQCSPLAENPSM